jgi:hypothetical protein
MLYITITLPDLANIRQSELLLVALAPNIEQRTDPAHGQKRSASCDSWLCTSKFVVVFFSSLIKEELL